MFPIYAYIGRVENKTQVSDPGTLQMITLFEAHTDQ